MVKDLPKKELIADTQLNAMGIKTWKRNKEFVFEFRPEIINEIRQLGFIIEALEVGGGSLPLPALADHIDKQAALEAYWSAAAEKARFEFQLAEDEWNRWYNKRYLWAFNYLKEMEGIPKPTAKEVDAKIFEQYKNKYEEKQKKLRKREYNYRLLCNVCHASIVTKGKMMQSLRNILQDGESESIKIRRTKVIDIEI